MNGQRSVFLPIRATTTLYGCLLSSPQCWLFIPALFHRNTYNNNTIIYLYWITPKKHIHDYHIIAKHEAHNLNIERVLLTKLTRCIYITILHRWITVLVWLWRYQSQSYTLYSSDVVFAIILITTSSAAINATHPTPIDNRGRFAGALRSRLVARCLIGVAMSYISVAKCTQKYSIATIFSGEISPTATLARPWSRKKTTNATSKLPMVVQTYH